MSKEQDRQTKTAPPRESDAVRQARFMSQTGLKSEGSAKMRRRKERMSSTHKQRKKHQ